MKRRQEKCSPGGCSSVGRASAFHAECRGFESRRPLQIGAINRKLFRQGRMNLWSNPRLVAGFEVEVGLSARLHVEDLASLGLESLAPRGAALSCCTSRRAHRVTLSCLYLWSKTRTAPTQDVVPSLPGFWSDSRWRARKGRLYGPLRKFAGPCSSVGRAHPW